MSKESTPMEIVNCGQDQVMQQLSSHTTTSTTTNTTSNTTSKTATLEQPQQETLKFSNRPFEQGTSQQDNPMTDAAVDNLSSGFQQCVLNQPFTEVMNSISECQQKLQTSTPVTIQFIINILPTFIAYQRQANLSITQQMLLMRELSGLNIDIESRKQFFSALPGTPPPNIQANAQPGIPQTQTQIGMDMLPPPVRTGPTVVQYKYLHQFITDMAFNTVSATSTKLDLPAQKQLQFYNDYSIRIDHAQHRNSPLRTVFSLRTQDFFQRHHLRKNQCEYLMARIAPQGNRVNSAILEFPTFNPDFQFDWTITFVSPSTLRCFDKFTDTHLASQTELPINKDLTIEQIKARFAFQQGSRWIRIHLDLRLNADLNERDAFCISNGFTPFQATSSERKFCRTFLVRDKNTTAWDGEYIFAYTHDESAFMKTYYRWCNVSPILKFGEFQVDILNLNVLPTLPANMPIPRHYEELLPISCHWTATTKAQLVTHLRDKFCPSLGIGGVYLPRFADPKYAVTGKLIRAQPRFYSEVSQEQEQTYFNWNIQEGKWNVCQTDLPQCFQYQNYTTAHPDPLQTQQEQWENMRMYDTQPFDEITTPEYGSMHFWMHYNRTTASNQILLTSSVLTPRFETGFNPFKPLIQDDPIVQLLFSYQNPHSDLEFQYQTYITRNSDIVPELAIRYRRSQSIAGYNAGYLSWRNRVLPGIFYKNRMPTPMELLYIPLNNNVVQQLRHRCSELSFIPKALVSHFDETTNNYYTHKRECIRLKYHRQFSSEDTKNTHVQRNKKPRQY